MLQPLQLLLAAILATALHFGTVTHPAIQPRPFGPAVSATEAASEQDQLRVEAVAARHALQVPAAVPPPTIPELITAAFAPLGPDALSWARRVAFCESTYNPNAVNTDSGAGGLFQFMPATWASSPFAAASPFDPAANSQAAAWLYQQYGPTQWDCQ